MGRFHERLVMGVTVLLFVAVSTFGIGVTAAKAANVIKLTYAGLWPPRHPISVAAKMWMDKIEKETHGRVKFKAFWAGALYKPRQSALELSKGVADVGGFSGAYSPKGFDFEKSMRMVFYGIYDRKLARQVYDQVLADFPQVGEEFTKAGIKVMAYASIPPYQLFLGKKPIRKLSDFKGLTAKASGDLAKIAAALGGEGIVMPMGECYTALQKGTIDAIFAPNETLKSFRFAEVVKYALELNIAPAPAGHWGFNLKSWNKLPKDIQKVFEDNMRWFGLKVEELMYANEDKGVNMAKKNGVKFLELPPGDMQKIYDVVDQTIRKKMDAMDAKGLPGTAVYKEIRRLIKEKGGK